MPIAPYDSPHAELKEAAELILDREGVSMSAYIRLSIMHLVAAGEIPFPDKRAACLRTGRPRKVVAAAAQREAM